MVEPERIQFWSKPEWSVPSKSPVVRPVLQVDGQLIQRLIVNVSKSPDQNITCVSGNSQFKSLTIKAYNRLVKAGRLTWV